MEINEIPIEYYEHLSMIVRARLEKAYPDILRRFVYQASIKTLYIPNRPDTKSLNWILTSINHECLHHILNEEENQETTIAFDTIPYNDLVSGRIGKDFLDSL